MEIVANESAASSAQLADVAHPALGLRVREVLATPALANAKVLAGASGLDRVVQRLNVMEVPDILPWVKPHELLLTTGYPLRHDPDGLAGLVAELDARGLAALAIKLHRYFDEVPAQMLAEADRLGFPIIEFPDGVGFDDVLHEVLSEMLNRQAAVLTRSEEVHRALVSVVLDGGGLADLTTELARILGGPVRVTTPDGEVLAQAGDESEVDGSAFRAVVPIVAGRVDHGRIVVLSRVPLTDADVHSLERAATVAALAITKRLAVAAVEDKYRADFLRDLLTGRAEDVPSAVAHARTFGWALDRPLVALVAALDSGVGADVARFAATWQEVVRSRDPQAAVVSYSDEVVTLLGAGADVDRLVADVDRLVRVSYSLGISRVASAATGIALAYDQACKAVRIGRRLHGDGARASFDRLGVHRLISLIPDTAELRGFVDEILGELAGDTPELADLRHTLEVLLDTNCNVAESARRLHFHYNTLRYRITKLERMVGPFTTAASLRLDLALALRILEVRGV
jgi:purine catabolism regulator